MPAFVVLRDYNRGAVGTFIERVELTNYKSIAHCDVALRPLTVVVGRNGSGKSNFVDSLQFIADALLTTLDYAIRKRGGVRGLVHRKSEEWLEIRLTFQFAGDRHAEYAFTLERGRVTSENLKVRSTRFGIGYERHGTEIRIHGMGAVLAPSIPAQSDDRLALVSLSGNAVFREAYDALTSMRLYRFDPDEMRRPQEPDPGEVLARNGSNIASIWGRLEKSNPGLRERLMDYLSAIVPDVRGVRYTAHETNETLQFLQTTGVFEASSMSDGTLRALGALVATRQENGSQKAATLVAIEEPETALHPGAIAALMDALHEASAQTQIIVTSHSPEVLDHVDLQTDALLVTELREGATVVAGVDEASREAIRRHLYTPGDLLRMDQLQPASK